MKRMPGYVIHNTPIAVDVWLRKQIQGAKLFFLSHAHADHIVGLSSTWRETIYTSPITAKIIIQRLQIGSHLIKTLEVNESHLIPLGIDNETITVTLIDANHCPGAVLFIFQGYFGTVVYTGDFRYCPEQVRRINEICRSDIDLLYLDNTFCHPNCEFPPKEEAQEEILKIIKRHEHYEIKIGLRSLGKEELLTAIASDLRAWIAVDDEKYKTLQLLDLPNVFTTDKDSSHISVVPFHSITGKQVKIWNDEYPTVVIIPTALFISMHSKPFSTFNNVFVIPYSDHSSYSELKTFVKSLQPNSVLPIVNETKGSRLHTGDMSVFKEYLNTENPTTVKKFSMGDKFMHMIQPFARFITKRPKHKAYKKSIPNYPKGITYISPTEDEMNLSIQENTVSQSMVPLIKNNKPDIYSTSSNYPSPSSEVNSAVNFNLGIIQNFTNMAITKEMMPTIFKQDIAFFKSFNFENITLISDNLNIPFFRNDLMYINTNTIHTICPRFLTREKFFHRFTPYRTPEKVMFVDFQNNALNPEHFKSQNENFLTCKSWKSIDMHLECETDLHEVNSRSLELEKPKLEDKHECFVRTQPNTENILSFDTVQKNHTENDNWLKDDTMKNVTKNNTEIIYSIAESSQQPLLSYEGSISEPLDILSVIDNEENEDNIRDGKDEKNLATQKEKTSDSILSKVHLKNVAVEHVSSTSSKGELGLQVIAPIKLHENSIGKNTQSFEFIENARATNIQSFEVGKILTEANTNLVFKADNINIPIRENINRAETQSFEVNENFNDTTTQPFEIQDNLKISETQPFEIQDNLKISETQPFEIQDNLKISETQPFEIQDNLKISETQPFEIQDNLNISETQSFESQDNLIIPETQPFEIRKNSDVSNTKGFDIKDPTADKNMQVKENADNIPSYISNLSVNMNIQSFDSKQKTIHILASSFDDKHRGNFKNKGKFSDTIIQSEVLQPGVKLTPFKTIADKVVLTSQNLLQLADDDHYKEKTKDQRSLKKLHENTDEILERKSNKKSMLMIKENMKIQTLSTIRQEKQKRKPDWGRQIFNPWKRLKTSEETKPDFQKTANEFLKRFPKRY